MLCLDDPQLLLFSYLEHLFGIRIHPLSLPLVIDVGTSAMSAAISTDVVADIILPYLCRIDPVALHSSAGGYDVGG